MNKRAPSQTEKIVGSIWKQMFRLNSISPDENFFALGGDSAHLVEMLYMVHKETGIDMGFGSILADATLGGFSSSVELRLKAAQKKKKRNVNAGN